MACGISRCAAILSQMLRNFAESALHRGILFHVICCAVQRQSSISSCCSSPLSDFSACLCSMLCIYRTTSSMVDAAAPTPLLPPTPGSDCKPLSLQSLPARRVEFQGVSAVTWCTCLLL